MNHLINRGYKFRLYPNRKQQQLIASTFGCCRFVYNHYLALSISQYESTGKSNTYNQNSKDLTQLKNELTWLKDIDSVALQQSLRNLDKAYQNFFRNVKLGRKPGFPKFKRKSNHHQSYRLVKVHDNYFNIENSRIRLGKLGYVRFVQDRDISGVIKQVVISQQPSGKYYVSLSCVDSEVDYFDSTGAVLGVDLGLKDLAITSDGEKIENPKWFNKGHKKLIKLQRQHAKKKIGSKNREKSRLKVARQYEKITNQRKDYLHKFSSDLIKNHDVICIENLNVKGMIRHKKLSKATADVSWGEFVSQLTYKAEWYGRKLIKIDRFFPSSQLCSCCGYKNSLVKDLTIRQWTCPQCGTTHDRDINAANNILKEGLRLLST